MGALALLALSDVAIVVFVALGQVALVPRLVETATTAGLFSMGALVVFAQRMTAIPQRPRPMCPWPPVMTITPCLRGLTR